MRRTASVPDLPSAGCKLQKMTQHPDDHSLGSTDTENTFHFHLFVQFAASGGRKTPVLWANDGLRAFGQVPRSPISQSSARGGCGLPPLAAASSLLYPATPRPCSGIENTFHLCLFTFHLFCDPSTLLGDRKYLSLFTFHLSPCLRRLDFAPARHSLQAASALAYPQSSPFTFHLSPFTLSAPPVFSSVLSERYTFCPFCGKPKGMPESTRFFGCVRQP